MPRVAHTVSTLLLLVVGQGCVTAPPTRVLAPSELYSSLLVQDEDGSITGSVTVSNESWDVCAVRGDARLQVRNVRRASYFDGEAISLYTPGRRCRAMNASFALDRAKGQEIGVVSEAGRRGDMRTRLPASVPPPGAVISPKSASPGDVVEVRFKAPVDEEALTGVSLKMMSKQGSAERSLSPRDDGLEVDGRVIRFRLPARPPNSYRLLLKLSYELEPATRCSAFEKCKARLLLARSAGTLKVR